MRMLMILLAVGTIVANTSGCICRRLCPLLDRGAACFPLTAPAAAPLVAAPAPLAHPCPPTPVATYWDPCQCAVITKPAAAHQPALVQPPLAQAPVAQPPLTQAPFAQPPFAQVPFAQPPFAPQAAAPPMVAQPSPLVYADPGCAVVPEPVCGEPYMGGMTYGPILMGDYPAGAVPPGIMVTPTPGEAFVDPGPAGE